MYIIKDLVWQVPLCLPMGPIHQHTAPDGLIGVVGANMPLKTTKKHPNQLILLHHDCSCGADHPASIVDEGPVTEQVIEVQWVIYYKYITWVLLKGCWVLHGRHCTKAHQDVEYPKVWGHSFHWCTSTCIREKCFGIVRVAVQVLWLPPAHPHMQNLAGFQHEANEAIQPRRLNCQKSRGTQQQDASSSMQQR